MVDNEALHLVNKMLLDSLQSLPRHPIIMRWALVLSG